MPLYDYNCPNCGEVQDIWAKIDETAKNCPNCRRIMVRIMSTTNIICDIQPYWDEVVAPEPVYFQSRQDKKEYLADRGLAIKGESLKTSSQYQEKKAAEDEVWRNKKRFGKS